MQVITQLYVILVRNVLSTVYCLKQIKHMHDNCAIRYNTIHYLH